MRATTISKLKIGEYFTFKPIEEPTEQQVYVRGEYSCSDKKFEYTKFTDVFDCKFAKGDRVVYVDFFF